MRRQTQEAATKDSLAALCDSALQLSPSPALAPPRPTWLTQVMRRELSGSARREIRMERAPETEVGHRDIIRTIRSTGYLPVGRCRPGCGGMNSTLKPRAARRAELHRLYDACATYKQGFSELLHLRSLLRLREGRRALSYQGFAWNPAGSW